MGFRKNKSKDKYTFKLCANTFGSIQKITFNIIIFYQKHYDNLKLEHEYLLNNEPLKIFRKKHLLWKIEKNELEKDINDTLKKLKEEIKDLN